MANQNRGALHPRAARSQTAAKPAVVAGRRSSIVPGRATNTSAPLVITALLWALAGAACTSGHAPQPAAADPRRISSHGGAYILEWKSMPERLPLNRYFELDVSIRQPLKPLNYAVQLEVDAGMLAHNHGMHTKPVVERLEPGRFRVHGMLFHMPGEWHLTFEIARGAMIDSAKTQVRL